MTAPVRTGPVVRRLARAEVRKSVSTRTWWAWTLGAALLSLLVMLGLAFGGHLFAGLNPLSFVAIPIGGFAAKVALLYGVCNATGEFRHRTIGLGYLAAPGRGRFLIAKLMVAAGTGAGMAIGCVLTLAPFLLWAGERLGGLVVWLVLGVVAMAIFALCSLLGTAIGMLIRDRTAAIVGVLAYQLLEIWIGVYGPSGPTASEFRSTTTCPSARARPRSSRWAWCSTRRDPGPA